MQTQEEDESESIETSQFSLTPVNPQLESAIKRERLQSPAKGGFRSIAGTGSETTVTSQSPSHSLQWHMEEVDPDVIPNRFGEALIHISL